VRNNVLNPSMRSAVNAFPVSTNFNLNPRPEAISGITAIRTNLYWNPRGVTVMSDYSGAANQTITTVTGIADNPDGITTANRVSYAAGASNPGVLVYNNLAANTKYTMSAWVYHETAPTSSGGQAFAMAGVVSQSPAPTIVQGQWQRLSWTYTTPASPTFFGFRVASPASAGSFLITGILVETSGVVSDFFDGAGTSRTNIVNDGRATSLTVTSGNIGWRGTRWMGTNGATGAYSLVTGATDGPQPTLTTYARKTWTTSPTNNGDTGFDHMPTGYIFTPGNTFTISSWLRPSSSGKVLQHSLYWVDTNNVILGRTNGPQINNAPAGQWSRLVTQTPSTVPYAGAVKFIVASDVQGATNPWAPGDTLDGTGLIIERTPTVSDLYYDGTGDFTYAWTGTANNSTSTMRGQAFTGYASPFNNRGAAIVSTQWFGSGTKSVRVIPLQPTDAANTATYTEMSVSGLTVGATYYITAKSYIPVPLTGTLDANFRRAIFPGTQPTSYTLLTAPSNTAGVQEFKAYFVAAATTHSIRFMNGAAEGGGDMWWADISVTDQQGPYFDGGTATDGDYTFYWTGASHASTSRRSTTPPLGVLHTSTSTTFRCTHTENGEKMARWSTPPFTPSANWRVALIQPLNWQNIKTGGTYTMLTLYRFSGAWSSSSFALFLQDGGATNSVPSSWLSDTTTDIGNGWKLNRKVFRAGRDATANTTYYMVLSTAATTTTEGIFDVKFAGIFDGNYTGDPFDGSSRLSKWDGAADASASVGYYPTLLDIAGKPDIDILGNSGSVTSASSVVDGFAARTFYVVYEVSDYTISPWQVPFNYGTNPSAEGFTLQSHDRGITQMIPRADFTSGGGGNNLTLSMGNSSRNVRMHVAAFSFSQGLTQITGFVDGAIDVTRTYTPGTVGWPNHRAGIHNPGNGMRGVRALAYWGEHDRETRLAIARYLGNKYGATVA
jgi:hypothetical protein